MSVTKIVYELHSQQYTIVLQCMSMHGKPPDDLVICKVDFVVV